MKAQRTDKKIVKRNAAITKQAILESAVRLFVKHGYDGVGVREIAAEVGVTAMMVNHYFGSKERLFAEVVENAYARKGIVTTKLLAGSANSVNFRSELIKALIEQTTPEGEMHDGLLLLLKSAANNTATDILRKKILEHFEAPLSKALTGANTKERTALLLAIIAGLQLFRQVINNEALAIANVRTLSRLLEPIFESLINTPDRR
jgi:AcrR family transcriptional regulator